MKFEEVLNKRVASREWTHEEVDFAAIRRILAAGTKAPTPLPKICFGQP